MSLDEPIIVSVIAVEEISFVVDVVTPPAVSSAIDVTVIDPAATVVVDVVAGAISVIDVVAPSGLSAVDVTVGDPLAAIVVDIPGAGSEDDVVGGKITIGDTAPLSPSINDCWVKTT